MSANRWSACPRCSQVAAEAITKKKAQAQESYGKVTPGEYLELVQEAAKPAYQEESLRQDFEIGFSRGWDFVVAFHAQCTTCGWSFSYKHDAPAYKKENT